VHVADDTRHLLVEQQSLMFAGRLGRAREIEGERIRKERDRLAAADVAPLAAEQLPVAERDAVHSERHEFPQPAAAIEHGRLVGDVRAIEHDLVRRRPADADAIALHLDHVPLGVDDVVVPDLHGTLARGRAFKLVGHPGISYGGNRGLLQGCGKLHQSRFPA